MRYATQYERLHILIIDIPAFLLKLWALKSGKIRLVTCPALMFVFFGMGVGNADSRC